MGSVHATDAADAAARSLTEKYALFSYGFGSIRAPTAQAMRPNRHKLAIFTATQQDGKLAPMKTTLDLPDELVREMKLRAVMQGRTLRDLAADFIRQGLGLAAPRPPQAPPPESMVQVGPSGLPVIRCRADAPALGLAVDDLLALEQQAQSREDMQGAGFPV